MKKLILMCVLALAAVAGAEEIVVLGETPVAEFTLPDGSTLKNAFVWRRSSEGLMIVHDDGQYFLNYQLLPAEWKAAYLGAPAEPEKEPAAGGDVEKKAARPLSGGPLLYLAAGLRVAP